MCKGVLAIIVLFQLFFRFLFLNYLGNTLVLLSTWDMCAGLQSTTQCSKVFLFLLGLTLYPDIPTRQQKYAFESRVSNKRRVITLGRPISAACSNRTTRLAHAARSWDVSQV
ncbi:unnamed protein product [Ixodes persulcatus]